MSLSARFGIARFGASRFGAYSPYLTIAIDGVGNYAQYIDLSSIEIIDRLNEQPNEARFTLTHDVSVVAGQTVVISLGTIDGGRLFGGVILNVTLRQDHYHHRPVYDVTARDFAWFLNQKAVNLIYRDVSISDIVVNLIRLFAPTLTTLQVALGLPSVDVFVIEDQFLTAVFSRLQKLAGSTVVWLVDEYGDLFFGASSTLTGPATLTSTNQTYWNLSAPTDLSQVRTRVIVKGRSTKTLVTVPNDYTPVSTYGVPLEQGWAFNNAAQLVNFGGQVFSYVTAIRAVDVGTDTPLFVTLTADADPDDTTISVDSTLPFLSVNNLYAWARDPDGNVFSFQADYPTFPTSLATVDSASSTSGYGAIRVTIPSGTQIYLASSLTGTVPADGRTGFDEIDQGEAARVRVMVEDTAAQTALAAIEGGDGIHEHIIDASEDDELSGAALAQADLDRYSSSLSRLTFSTRNRRAVSGRDVVVSLSGETNLSGTFPIQEVTITGFDALAANRTRRGLLTRWPVRHVDATPVRQASIVDVIAGPLNF